MYIMYLVHVLEAVSGIQQHLVVYPSIDQWFPSQPCVQQILALEHPSWMATAHGKNAFIILGRFGLELGLTHLGVCPLVGR
jgi:hypothetical protein